jgi:hypothetical protein
VQRAEGAFMATTAPMKKEFEESYNLQSELCSLGIECKRLNEFNDKDELKALATAIKEVYFQDYKTAYNNTSNTEIDQSHFGHLI